MSPDPEDRLARIEQALNRINALLSQQANGQAAAEPPAAQPVTLDQAAVMVHVARRTLYRYRNRGLPAPVRQGARGRPALYEWSAVRLFLESVFAMHLPIIHPYHVRS